MVEIIKLRGHHLRTLANCLESLSERPSIGPLKDRLFEGYRKIGKLFGYSNEVMDYTSELFRKIIEEDVKVKLINTLDNICEKCNKRINGVCQEFEYYWNIIPEVYDMEYINKYKLGVGKIYSSRYLIKKLKKK